MKYTSNSEPYFYFQVPEFKNWEIKLITPTVIVFEPQGLPVLFEVPPSVAIIKGEMFNKQEHEVIFDWKNLNNNTDYKKYFVKEFQQNLLFFKQEEKTAHILLPFNVIEHGLDSRVVEQKIVESFKFSNSTSL